MRFFSLRKSALLLHERLYKRLYSVYIPECYANVCEVVEIELNKKSHIVIAKFAIILEISNIKNRRMRMRREKYRAIARKVVYE